MNQKNKETYWSQFADKFEEKQSYVTGKEIISLALDALGKEENLGKVLEPGCGTGVYTDKLKGNAEHVIATDFSDEMIEIAKKKRGNLADVQFEKADALDLNFEEASFDTVFMANLIHIIGDAERVIKESKRVLKQGGKVIITSFAIDEMSFFHKLRMATRYIKAFGKPSKDATKEKTTKKNVETMLINNGFEIAKSEILGNKSKATYIVGRKK